MALVLTIAVMLAYLPFPSAMAAPEISLSPSEAHLGDRVLVTGSGFGKISPVVITFDGEKVEKTTTVKGGIYKDFRVPQSRHGEVTVTAADKEGNVASAVLTVINDVPVAKDARLAVNEDEHVNIVLSASDPNDDTLTYTISKEPVSGTLVGFNATSGKMTYAPEQNYSGNDSLEFFVSDGLDESAKATVSIAVAPVNDPPIAESSSLDVDEDSKIEITLEGSDPDGDELTFSVSNEPDHGTLSGTPPHLTYTPASGYVGNDSFGFSAYDDSEYSSTATVNIEVLPVNSPPSATDAEVETEEDTSVTIHLAATKSHDVDFDVKSNPSHGSLGTIEKTGPLTAEVTYRPQHNYFGTDIFTFSASDGDFESEAATVKIDIEPVNDAPEAISQNVSAEIGKPIEITLRGSDVEGDDLDFLVVQGAKKGTLGSMSHDDNTAIVTYTPDPDEDGQDSFSFRISDGDLESDIGVVTISVHAQIVAKEETAQARDVITTEDSIASNIQLGGDSSGEVTTLETSSQGTPAADETPVEVPPPEDKPEEVVQGAALKSLSTTAIQDTSLGGGPAAWVIPVVLVGGASAIAFLGYRQKGVARGILAVPKKILGLIASTGLVQPETVDDFLSRSADQSVFSDQMSRIYKTLNNKRCRAARKQIFSVQYGGMHIDPTEYEKSKQLAKKEFERIGTILHAKPELQEPYFESFGELTLKVWWAIKEGVELDRRKGMPWESLEWLGEATEKYWAKQSDDSKIV